MGLGRGLLGGLVGAAIGAVLWAAVSYWIVHEAQPMGWILGILTGVGFRVARGDDEDDGWAPGIVAGLITLPGFFAAKAATLWLIAGYRDSSFDVLEATPEYVVLRIAEDVCDEYAAKRRPMRWPFGKNRENVEGLEDYPREVRAEAEKRWSALGKEKQDARLRQDTEELRRLARGVSESIGAGDRYRILSRMGVVFMIAGILSAFRIASGVIVEEDDEPRGILTR